MSIVTLILTVSSSLYYTHMVHKNILMHEEDISNKASLVYDLFTYGYSKSDFNNLADVEKFIQTYEKNLDINIFILDESNNNIFKSSTNFEIPFEYEACFETYDYQLELTYLNYAKKINVNNKSFSIITSTSFLTTTYDLNNDILNMFLFIIILCAVSFILCNFLFKKTFKLYNNFTSQIENMSEDIPDFDVDISNYKHLEIISKTFDTMKVELENSINQLENENLKMTTIINSMTHGVVAISKTNKILFINDVCINMFNITLFREIIGLNFYDYIRNEDVYKLIDQCKTENKYVSDIFSIKSHLENEIIVRTSVNPILNIGNDNDGTLIVFQDITQIRKLEQLRNDFVSNVTHELKTPLTSIMGFTDTLISGAINDNKTALKFLNIIDVESKRLNALIIDILELSEIETRKEDKNLDIHNVADILYDVENLLEGQALNKNINLNIEVSDDNFLFSCNNGRICQVFINVIENAIKYTEEGSVNVKLYVKDNFINFTVKDSGIGIPKESVDRIFERFYRVDKARSRKEGGTGLGLSIVKHIVLLYEGFINVTSEENVGTTINIKLPFKRII